MNDNNPFNNSNSLSKGLSLTDLESFDPHASPRSGERRFLCPFCGGDKPRDAAHRSFCLNSSNGLYHCKRCNCKGQLIEHWENKPSSSDPTQAKHDARARANERLRRAFEVRPPSPVKVDLDNFSTPPSSHTDWHLIWNRAGELNGTPGETYLRSRGLSPAVANAADVRFVVQWGVSPALVFPFRDASAEIVAVGGRCIRECRINKPASGPKSSGAFWAYTCAPGTSQRRFGPFDENVPAVVVCEAPLDALSLAQAGYPALAVGGTSTPEWLVHRLAFRRVALAFDADTPGDKAADALQTRLLSFGARPFRLRPEGNKDWNALLLELGSDALCDLLAPHLL